jgi:hypothetical protein
MRARCEAKNDFVSAEFPSFSVMCFWFDDVSGLCEVAKRRDSVMLMGSRLERDIVKRLRTPPRGVRGGRNNKRRARRPRSPGRGRYALPPPFSYAKARYREVEASLTADFMLGFLVSHALVFMLQLAGQQIIYAPLLVQQFRVLCRRGSRSPDGRGGARGGRRGGNSASPSPDRPRWRRGDDDGADRWEMA